MFCHTKEEKNIVKIRRIQIDKGMLAIYSTELLDEPIFMAGPKPMRTEFGIRQRLESCSM